jgi:hypothetical protein
VKSFYPIDTGKINNHIVTLLTCHQLVLFGSFSQYQPCIQAGKVPTVEETIAELHSDPFSDISDLELSNAETVGSSLPTTSVWKITQSLSGDSTDSEHSSTDISNSEINEQSDISDLESSNAETVGSSLPTSNVRKITQSLPEDSTDSEHSSTDISDSKI